MEIQIQKLKKRLLREELRRRRRSSRTRLWLICGVLFALILAIGSLTFYANLDRLLEKRFAEAEILLAEGAYERAAASFRGIYERHPGFHLAPRALYQSAEVDNLYLRRYEEAILAYLLVEKEYPGSELALRAQRQVAEVYKNRLRDYPRAIVALQQLLDGGGEGADRLQYEVADAYFRLENFAQARIEFETLLRNHPQSPLLPEATYRLAVTWSLEGKPREAEKVFRRVVESWPESPYAVEARFGLAASLEDREELREALAILERLAGVYPNAEALAKKTDQVRERIKRKRKAI